MWRKMDLNNGQILTLLHQLLYYLVCQVWRDLLIIFHDELPVGKLTCRGGLRQWYVKLSCVNMSLNIKKCADFQLVRQWLQNLSHKYNHNPFSAFFLLFFYFFLWKATVEGVDISVTLRGWNWQCFGKSTWSLIMQPKHLWHGTMMPCLIDLCHYNSFNICTSLNWRYVYNLDRYRHDVNKSSWSVLSCSPQNRFFSIKFHLSQISAWPISIWYRVDIWAIIEST